MSTHPSHRPVCGARRRRRGRCSRRCSPCRTSRPTTGADELEVGTVCGVGRARPRPRGRAAHLGLSRPRLRHLRPGVRAPVPRRASSAPAGAAPGARRRAAASSAGAGGSRSPATGSGHRRPARRLRRALRGSPPATARSTPSSWRCWCPGCCSAGSAPRCSASRCSAPATRRGRPRGCSRWRSRSSLVGSSVLGHNSLGARAAVRRVGPGRRAAVARAVARPRTAAGDGRRRPGARGASRAPVGSRPADAVPAGRPAI